MTTLLNPFSVYEPLPIVGVAPGRRRHWEINFYQNTRQDPRPLAWGKARRQYPSSISRVAAKRLKTVGGRNRRELSAKPSDCVSMSPSTAEMMPSPCFGQACGQNC